MVVRAGLLPTLSNRTAFYTMFVPTNNAVKLLVNAASGGLVPLNAPDPVFVNFIQTNLPVASANAIVVIIPTHRSSGLLTFHLHS